MASPSSCCMADQHRPCPCLSQHGTLTQVSLSQTNTTKKASQCKLLHTLIAIVIGQLRCLQYTSTAFAQPEVQGPLKQSTVVADDPEEGHRKEKPRIPCNSFLTVAHMSHGFHFWQPESLHSTWKVRGLLEGLVSINYGLLLGIAYCCSGLLGILGTFISFPLKMHTYTQQTM